MKGNPLQNYKTRPVASGAGPHWGAEGHTGGLGCPRGIHLAAGGLGFDARGRCTSFEPRAGAGFVSMQLVELVARRHGVDRDRAQKILWRRIISLRVRVLARCLGWFSPGRVADLERMVLGFGRCESYETAAHDAMFYKNQAEDIGFSAGSLLFSFSVRRMERVAADYFGEKLG